MKFNAPFALILSAMATCAWAQASSTKSVNTIAIIMFLAFVAVTLGITWWAARRTKTANDFYAA
ncbi:MAG: cation acetate symporter, partial [Cellvibrio sp.]|nr:cation acetate symporter [Cellvibrio sp.]